MDKSVEKKLLMRGEWITSKDCGIFVKNSMCFEETKQSWNRIYPAVENDRSIWIDIMVIRRTRAHKIRARRKVFFYYHINRVALFWRHGTRGKERANGKVGRDDTDFGILCHQQQNLRDYFSRSRYSYTALTTTCTWHRRIRTGKTMWYVKIIRIRSQTCVLRRASQHFICEKK